MGVPDDLQHSLGADQISEHDGGDDLAKQGPAIEHAFKEREKPRLLLLLSR